MKEILSHSFTPSQFLDMILVNYRGSIIISDENGRIVACSNGTSQLMELPKEEIIGTTMTEFQERGVVSDSVINKCIASQQESETFLYINGNSSQTIYAYAKPIFDDTGKLKNVIAFSQDKKTTKNYVAHMEEMLKKQMFSSLDITTSQHRNQIIAVSKQSKLMFEYAKEVADIDANVILYGESGTGKEVLANYIHKNSNRKDHVFVTVNCAAMPESLIESEIFGYEKGSFTGASKEGKMGLFELADKGTLFLDEIGELPLNLQPKLLRVIETGEIRKLGSNTTKTVNIRLITATNRDLREMVNNGTFREDLYYRLNVFPISVPSLRQRKDDIIPLIEHYMHIYNKKYRRQVQIPDEAYQILSNYSWPGNIRELKNFVQRYIITKGRFTLDEALHGNGHISTSESDLQTGITTDINDQSGDNSSVSFKEYTSNCEKKYFKEMLIQTNGDVAKVAAASGLHISSIYKKLENLGLNPKDYKNNNR